MSGTENCRYEHESQTPPLSDPLITGALYDDPGADYFNRHHDPAREAQRLQRRIEGLGFEVSIIAKAA